MDELQKAIRTYATDAAPLAQSDTSREETYYPAVRNLLAAILKNLGLTIEVRTSTSERRSGGGIDHQLHQHWIACCLLVYNCGFVGY